MNVICLSVSLCLSCFACLQHQTQTRIMAQKAADETKDQRGCNVVVVNGEPVRILVGNRCGLFVKTVRYLIYNRNLIPERYEDDLEGWLMLNGEIDCSGGDGSPLIPRFLDVLERKKIETDFEVFVDVPLSFWEQKW